MTEGVDEPYYCPICDHAWTRTKCYGCGYEAKACGHPEENHGPVGELTPERKFNFNIFGDCDVEEVPE